MGFRLPRISSPKRSLIRSLSIGNQTASKTLEIPKGYFAVYVGESQKKRFVIPISYLNQPSFMDLLSQAEEEYGYDHPMGGITIPCSEDTFLDLTSSFSVHSRIFIVLPLQIIDTMGFRLPRISSPKRSLIRSLSNGNQTAPKTLDIPKGYFPVYVGESQNKRFVIPISYLNQPSFMDLLSQAEEEFGYDHPMGGITIPCGEETFLDLTSSLNTMGFRFHKIASTKTSEIPKGYLAVYVGESQKKRFVVPISYMNQPLLPRISNTKRSLARSSSNGNQTAPKTLDIPKGCFAVYVGESQKKRFVIPISYLNQPSFMDLLSQAEEEFGYNHPMGGITIPCSEETFLDLTSSLSEDKSMCFLKSQCSYLEPISVPLHQSFHIADDFPHTISSSIYTHIIRLTMGFRLPRIANTKTSDIPKGYFAVYVGESQKKRFVVPISYLNQPLFLDLLSQAEEEFGYHHPMGGITIPCSQDTFIDLTSRLSVLPRISNTKRRLTRSSSNGNQTASKTLDIPKGYFAVYVGESQKKRFVIPISYLNQPSFMDLLSQAEEEFGYDHPMGGITIPCSEDTFLDLTSSLNMLLSQDEEEAGVITDHQLN
ncbi:hypothetical protein ACLB2K_052676 [Fragaria x ananassa]